MKEDQAARGNAGGSPNGDRDLAARIERALADEAGIFADVRIEDGVVYLEGLVESAGQRDAATDLAYAVGGVARVQNDLDVEEFDPQPSNAAPDDDLVYADTTYQMLQGDTGQRPEPLELDPDFNDPFPKVGDDMTTDSMVATEEGIPYEPPTDPVVRPSYDDQDLQVLVGFGETSMDDFPDQSAETALGDAPPGDEDIRSEVLEALATDAVTADFQIHVVVRNGIAHLRGRVPTLDDAEMVEEVAARVPEVREVIDEMDIDALE